jgi:hypothetical protein
MPSITRLTRFAREIKSVSLSSDGLVVLADCGEVRRERASERARERDINMQQQQHEPSRLCVSAL